MGGSTSRPYTNLSPCGCAVGGRGSSVVTEGMSKRHAVILVVLVAVAACKGSDEVASPPVDGAVQELSLIRSAMEAGQVSQAVTRAFALSKAQPDLVEVRLLLASAYVLDRQHGKALLVIDGALEKDARIPGAHATRGAALRGLGRVDEAIEASEQALVLDANERAALTNLVALYEGKKRWKDQQKVLEALCRLVPDDPALWMALASCYSSQGDLKAARIAAKEAVQRDAKNADIHVFLAAASYELGKWPDAMDHADIAVKLDPERGEAVEIFKASFYVGVASRLQCLYGNPPYTRTQKKEGVRPYRLQGLEGVMAFQDYDKQFGSRKDVRSRIERASADCVAP